VNDHEHPLRRAEDHDGGPPRVFTMKQMAAILGLVALLQTVGGKFVIDSYIDARIKFHDRDPNAHAGIMAGKADIEKLTDHLERIEVKIDVNSQRLSRIEGAIATHDARQR